MQRDHQMASYFLMVARQASERADRATRARTLEDIRTLQVQHERQLSAVAGMLSAIMAGAPRRRVAVVVRREVTPPRTWRARLAAAWAALTQ